LGTHDCATTPRREYVSVPRARAPVAHASWPSPRSCGLLAGPAVGSALAAPVDNSLPEVLGTAKLGGELQCASGSGAAVLSKFYFTWVRDGVEIEGHIHSGTPRILLQKADEGE